MRVVLGIIPACLKARRIVAWSVFALGLTGCSQAEHKAETDPASPSSQARALTPIPPVNPNHTLTAPRTDEINTIAEIDFTAYSMALAKFVGLEIGESKSVSNDKIRAYFKPSKGAEGNAEYVFSEFRGEGGNVILATANGLADDSVKGEELYAVFKDDILITYGTRLKCWRADNPDIWSQTPCP